MRVLYHEDFRLRITTDYWQSEEVGSDYGAHNSDDKIITVWRLMKRVAHIRTLDCAAFERGALRVSHDSRQRNRVGSRIAARDYPPRVEGDKERVGVHWK